MREGVLKKIQQLVFFFTTQLEDTRWLLCPSIPLLRFCLITSIQWSFCIGGDITRKKKLLKKQVLSIDKLAADPLYIGRYMEYILPGIIVCFVTPTLLICKLKSDDPNIITSHTKSCSGVLSILVRTTQELVLPLSIGLCLD